MANLLLANDASLETSVGNWTAFSCGKAVAQSATQAHSGTYSLRVTRSATAAGHIFAAIGNTPGYAAVTPSSSYQISYWAYIPYTGYTLACEVDWYDSTGTNYLSSNSNLTPVACSINTWTQIGVATVTSPSTAYYGSLSLFLTSGGANNDLFYIDDLFFGTAPPVTGADTGAGSESYTIVSSGIDTGTGTDSAFTSSSFSSADTETTSENATVNTGNMGVSSADTGTGIDGINGLDFGTGTEGIQPVQVSVAAESGTASDAYVLAIIVADNGTGTEGLGAFTASLADSDVYSGLDNFIPYVGDSDNDTGTGSETQVALLNASSSDSGTSVESNGAFGVSAFTDTGTIAEDFTSTAVLAAADTEATSEVAFAGTQIPTSADAGSSTEGAAITIPPFGNIPGSWCPIFTDEFTAGSLDPSKWVAGWQGTTLTAPRLLAEDAAYDSTLSTVVSDLLWMATVSSDALVGSRIYPYRGSFITTNPHDGRTSAGFEFIHGYAEVRMFVPGYADQITNVLNILNFPFFATLGQNTITDGEIDIFQAAGGLASFQFQSGGELETGYPSDPAGYTGWHVFGMQWEPGEIDYYYDGVLVGTVFYGNLTETPMYLALAYSLSASLGGQSSSGHSVAVDYVRVWQNTLLPNPISSHDTGSGSESQSQHFGALSGDTGYANEDLSFRTVSSSDTVVGIDATSVVNPSWDSSGEWSLAFFDNFTGSSLNTAIWQPNWLGPDNVSVTAPSHSDERAACDPAQVSVSGGLLHLATSNSAVTVSGTPYSYRTGLVTTYLSESFLCTATGQLAVEARINIPGNGSTVYNSPAFWLFSYTPDELDVVAGTLGSLSSFWNGPPYGNPGGITLGASPYVGGFHTYGAVLTASTVSWYFDGTFTGSVSTNVSGANWTPVPVAIALANSVGSADSPHLTDLQVDYVRVWQ